MDSIQYHHPRTQPCLLIQKPRVTDSIIRVWRITAAGIAIAVVALGVAGLASPTSAQAETRVATAEDPADATPTVGGIPNNPDIRRLIATYDTAGSLSVTVNFYNSIASLDLSQNYAMSGQFTLGKWVRSGAYDYCRAEVSGQHHVTWSGSGSSFYNRATIDGYDGYLALSRTVDSAGTSITVTGSSPALAGRDITCLTYHLSARRLSSASNPNSQYDSVCDCWFISVTLDVVGQSSQYDTIGRISFSGYELPPHPECSNGADDDGDGKTDYPADPDCSSYEDASESPPPPPACSDGVDNDGDRLIDLKDPGCAGKKAGTSEADSFPVRASFALKAKARKCSVETEVDVLPDLKPARNFPFNRVRITVMGPKYSKTKQIPLGYYNAYVFKVPSNGRYQVSGYYLGDRFRTKSKTKATGVRVRNCN